MSEKYKFIAELPPGYDARTRLHLTDANAIEVVHPDLPALVLNERTGNFEPIDVFAQGTKSE